MFWFPDLNTTPIESIGVGFFPRFFSFFSLENVELTRCHWPPYGGLNRVERVVMRELILDVQAEKLWGGGID